MGQINTGGESDYSSLELLKQFVVSRSWRWLFSPRGFWLSLIGRSHISEKLQQWSASFFEIFLDELQLLGPVQDFAKNAVCLVFIEFLLQPEVV